MIGSGSRESSPMIISMASRCFWKSLENSKLLHSIVEHEHIISGHMKDQFSQAKQLHDSVNMWDAP